MKLIFKSIVIIACLALLVLMGMNNPQSTVLKMPPLFPAQQQPAAIMYFAFFGVGFIAGAVLMVGGKKGGSSSPKPAK